ncbi:MAG: hypothetical protein ACI4B3_10250 [Prevotella sp.]
MAETTNFITKAELDALYDSTLWIMSERFFGKKEHVWDDVLPAAADILTSKDYDNKAWLLTRDWENEIYDSLPNKAKDDMSEEEIKKYSSESQPIVEVFKRCVKMYVLFCFFCKDDSVSWDIENQDPLEKVKERLRKYLSCVAADCKQLLFDKRLTSEINRCRNCCNNIYISQDYPIYYRSRLMHIDLSGLMDVEVDKQHGCCNGHENGSSGNCTEIDEKNKKIEELEAKLKEQQVKIAELEKKVDEQNIDWDNAEDIEKETPKSVQLFFMRELLNTVFKKDTEFAKRDLVVLASLLFNYDSPKSVYSHPIPLNNNYVFKSKNEKEKIFDIAAVLIHGMGVNDNSFSNMVKDICGKIPNDEAFVKLVSRLLPTKKK